LLLRGPRTPGELRANSGRLHAFADNQEVEQTLASLSNGEQGELVVQLPRTPGRRDSEFMHLLSGEIDVGVAAPVAEVTARTVAQGPGLHQRVEQLEAEVAELKERLNQLAAN